MDFRYYLRHNNFDEKIALILAGLLCIEDRVTLSSAALTGFRAVK